MSKKTQLSAAFLGATLATLVTSSAFAQEAAKAAETNKYDIQAWSAVGAGFAIGLAVLGGALGQGRAAAAALEGISRNPGAAPKIQTPMILGLALIESLVLFAFLIAFLLYGKITGLPPYERRTTRESPGPLRSQHAPKLRPAPSRGSAILVLGDRGDEQG